MSTLILERGARILVCDGKTALFIKNAGPLGHPHFEVEQALHQELPSHTADMGTDKPGRVGSSDRRSSVEPADWHDDQEKAFVKAAVHEFSALCQQTPQAQIVIVAPPRALATIRDTADKALMSQCVAQIHKDLTRHPLAEIQKIVMAAEVKG